MNAQTRDPMDMTVPEILDELHEQLETLYPRRSDRRIRELRSVLDHATREAAAFTAKHKRDLI